MFDEIELTISENIPGDFNYDGHTDLTDAIICLKLISGIIPENSIYLNADVNGDDRIGLEDILYIMQKSSGQ